MNFRQREQVRLWIPDHDSLFSGGLKRLLANWIPNSRWRLLATPMGPSEIRLTERRLAVVRVSLAICAFFSVWMYPTQISWLHTLLFFYVLYSAGVMLLLKFHKQSTEAFRSLVHVADLIWPALIYGFPATQNLSFLFLVFVLAAAAYRWGVWETVGTAASSLILLWLESVVLRDRVLAPMTGFLPRYHWPFIQYHSAELVIDAGELQPKKLLVFSVCLLLMGWLLGYLAEQHKQLRAELERATLARELHDGVLQSLLGLNMRLHVLSNSQQGSTAKELRQIQEVLIEEARRLRELMQQIKPLDVDATTLRAHLSEITQRFERETGIRTTIHSDSSVLDIERSSCSIVVRIVQEALTNVRKHSCATDVWVGLNRNDATWQLTIEDNGVGFPYSGRLHQSELKASGRGPLVIIECVGSIRGELTLESMPNRGSRLEITFQ